MSERQLPTAHEAVRVTIRSIMLDPMTLPDVMQIITAGDIDDERDRAIYSTIVRHHSEGKPVDAVLISQELRGTKLFPADPKDGTTIAMALAAIADSTSTAAHAKHYAEIVARVGKRRRSILRTSDALNRLWQEDETAKVLDDLRSDIEHLQIRPADRVSTSELLFDQWAKGITERQPQQVFECGPYGSEIAKFQFGPGEVVMIGAPPAAGKTAFIGQVGTDALRMSGQEHLRLLIANVEMPAAALLTRQLCRICGVSYSYLNFRDYSEDAKPRIQAAIDDLRSLMPRVEFMRPPFTLENVTRRVEAFEADIVVLDYAQRFSSEGKQLDTRSQTNATMDCCRLLAERGRAVLVVSALSRHKSSSGSTYDSKALNLASFRESSELEYGADSAWLLLRDGDSEHVELKQVKNRTGKLCSLNLIFDGSHQSFRDNPRSTEWDPTT